MKGGTRWKIMKALQQTIVNIVILEEFLVLKAPKVDCLSGVNQKINLSSYCDRFAQNSNYASQNTYLYSKLWAFD